MLGISTFSYRLIEVVDGVKCNASALHAYYSKQFQRFLSIEIMLNCKISQELTDNLSSLYDLEDHNNVNRIKPDG